MMDDNLQDFLTESGDAIINALTESPLLEAIPVISQSVKIAKVISSIRDTAYLNKLKRFMDRLDSFSTEQKDKLLEESRRDKNSRVKFGESVYTTIEQSDSMVKIDYLGCVFEAFVNGDITKEDLRYLSHAIRSSFVDDLVSFIESKRPPSSEDLQYHVSSGLAAAEYQVLTFDMETTGPKYSVSRIGEFLRMAWRDYGDRSNIK